MRFCLVIAFMLLSVMQASAEEAYTPPFGLKSLRASAERGDADAQGSLGVMYHEGLGVKLDLGEAVKWFRRSAEQGLATSQYNLGYLYEKGEGVEKNLTTASDWYRKAADQGDAAAQASLGALYSEGRGVKQNDAEAYFWLSLGAKEGTVNDSDLQTLATRLTDVEKTSIQLRIRDWKPVLELKPAE
jgi:TPR repeat protein